MEQWSSAAVISVVVDLDSVVSIETGRRSRNDLLQGVAIAKVAVDTACMGDNGMALALWWSSPEVLVTSSSDDDADAEDPKIGESDDKKPDIESKSESSILSTGDSIKDIMVES